MAGSTAPPRIRGSRPRVVGGVGAYNYKNGHNAIRATP